MHPTQHLTRFALAAALALAMTAIGIAPALADVGDVWTQPGGTPEETAGHSQEVHLDCGPVDVWADGLGQSGGAWTLYRMPPPPAPDLYVTEGDYARTTTGDQLVATIPQSAFIGQAGPKYKVEVANGETKKSKVFWVTGCTTITTQQSPAEAIVGSTLNDSATLTGYTQGNYEPTGTITFTLLGPGGATVHTESVSVAGNGSDYATSGGFVATVPGTYHWVAAYSGDAWNLPATSAAADEPVVVTGEPSPAQPSIRTAPDPASATVGAGLRDSAVLSDGDGPTGTITFKLYDPQDGLAYTESVAVDGNGTYTTTSPFVATSVGTWHWQAAYGGDARNGVASSTLEEEPVVVGKARPTIVTTPSPSSALGSATLKDGAVLAGGFNPTGSITFTLYDPAGKVAHTETVTVSGNGTYTTPAGHYTNGPGTWHWVAAYSGDAGNAAFTSNPADEPVTIVATGAILAETGLSTPLQALAFGLVLLGLLLMVTAVARRRRSL